MKKKYFIILLLFLHSFFSYSQWTQKSDFGGSYRYGAVGFSIGVKGYVATGYKEYTPPPFVTKDFWEYDPSTDSWLQKADFAGTARSESIGFSIGSKGYIGTGIDSAGLLKDFWEYDAGTNAWTQKADFPGTARYQAVGFSIGSKGYIGTGLDSTGLLKDFWEYDSNTDTWTQKANFGGSARRSAVGFAINNNGYIGTGWGTNPELKDFWEYNSANDSWIQIADLNGNSRYAPVSFTIGQKGYVGTGGGLSIYMNFCEYDPATNIWIQKSDFPVSEGERHSAVGFSIGAKGYITTGKIESIDFPSIFKDLWEYDLNADNIEEVINNFEIIILPNPSAANVTITLPQKSTIQFLNLQGQIIKSLNANETNTTIDISNFAKGMYFVKVKMEKGIAVKKFIKE